MRGIICSLALAVLPTCGGCFSTPSLLHPGSEDWQQKRAAVFEPYPEREPGPEIVGGRPREYQDPRAEIFRVRRQDDGLPLLAPVPQPLCPVGTVPQVVAPSAVTYPSGVMPP